MNFLRNWRIVGAIVLAVLIIIVVIQNTEAVDTKILFFTVSTPRAILLFVTLLVGFVLGLLTAWRARRRAGAKEAKPEAAPPPGKDA